MNVHFEGNGRHETPRTDSFSMGCQMQEGNNLLSPAAYLAYVILSPKQSIRYPKSCSLQERILQVELVYIVRTQSSELNHMLLQATVS